MLKFPSNIEGLKRSFKTVFGKALATLAFAAVALAASPREASAAQDAVVTVEQAAVREIPSIDAKIIETKPVGSKLKVSSYAKDGWYRTRAVTGQYGWIWQGDLTLSEFQDDVKAANLNLAEHEHERRDPIHVPWLFLRAGGGFSLGFNQIGLTSPTMNLEADGFAEVAIRLRNDLRGAIRLMSFGTAFTISDTSGFAETRSSATAALLGLEQDVAVSETTRWWLGFYGGLDLTTSTSSFTNSTAPSQLTNTNPAVTLSADGTQFTYNTTGYAFLVTIGYSWEIIPWFSLLGEAGLLYNYVPQTALPSYGGQHENSYGPVVNFGAQINI